MKSAGTIADEIRRGYDISNPCATAIEQAIRAAQIVAAEWMREEAAKVADMAARMLQEKARAHSDPGDRLMYLSVAGVSTGTATDIRAIKLPGDGE